MTDQFAYSYPSPLEGYGDLEPLTDERNEDGKSLKNPETGILSKAYEEFPDPVSKGRRGGFDVHIYHFQVNLTHRPINLLQFQKNIKIRTNSPQTNPDQVAYAKALHERIRREFPELRIYKFFDQPIGPHPVAMFEVNVFTPAQFGAFIPWLVINRGQLSALIHPNTDIEVGRSEGAEEERNHTQRATWLGDKIPLDLRLFKLWKEKDRKEEEEKEKQGRL
ncbi:uncharacterized protein N7484_007421 [Penicillium longicatenatum]|uniref:uncharacterized protein n=1 Tax=Penicillium longicatenatum TaxID=1561947 RepID=UPI0025487641|nr:uncharacterized protein N7484_007421 [Penicillium longicatenatum]KAJ5639559.1 hypothetical protein N7484_007421 [Penicillium longicatenatum]